MSNLTVNVQIECAFLVLKACNCAALEGRKLIIVTCDCNSLIFCIVRSNTACYSLGRSIKYANVLADFNCGNSVTLCKILSCCKLAVLVNLYKYIFVSCIDIIETAIVKSECDFTVFFRNGFDCALISISIDYDILDIIIIVIADKFNCTALSNKLCKTFSVVHNPLVRV